MTCPSVNRELRTTTAAAALLWLTVTVSLACAKPVQAEAWSPVVAGCHIFHQETRRGARITLPAGPIQRALTAGQAGGNYRPSANIRDAGNFNTTAYDCPEGNTASRWIIVGRTDATGDAVHNGPLSWRRARAVADLLQVRAGIPEQSLHLYALADDSDGHSPTAAANNRCADIFPATAQPPANEQIADKPTPEPANE